VNSRRPPRLAVWLLRSTGLARHNEPLAGDLLEEFRNGRTAAWYWRQAFMAIAAEFGQSLRSRRLELLALCGGWAAESCSLFVWWILHGSFVADLVIVFLMLFSCGAAWVLRSPDSSLGGAGDGKSHGSPSLLILGTGQIVGLFAFVAQGLPQIDPVYLFVLHLLLTLNLLRLFFGVVRTLRALPNSSLGARNPGGDA